MTIAEQLRKFRKLRKFSAVECAQKIGVSQSTYRDWENGRAISGEPYKKIAKVLSVSLSELFGIDNSELSIQLEELDLILKKASDHIKDIRSCL